MNTYFIKIQYTHTQCKKSVVYQVPHMPPGQSPFFFDRSLSLSPDLMVFWHGPWCSVQSTDVVLHQERHFFVFVSSLCCKTKQQPRPISSDQKMNLVYIHTYIRVYIIFLKVVLSILQSSRPVLYHSFTVCLSLNLLMVLLTPVF